MLLLFDSSTPQFISADILTFSSIVETKAPCLDSTLSQQLSSWFSPRHLRRQSRAGSPGHTGEWPRADSYPKVFCSRTLSLTLIFSLALINILVGLFVQLALVVYIAGKINLIF